MKLSEYKLLIQYMKEDKFYWEIYNFFKERYNKKLMIKKLYKSLKFKGYLLNYYKNEIKKVIFDIIKTIIKRIKNEKM